jgi:7-carboxy-7-deazaguanine synthase
MDALSQRGYTVLLETNGSLDIGAVPNSVHIVMDVKCPSSGMHDRMYFENFNLLKSIDDVKFVIADRTDFDYAVDVILTHGVHRKANCILSPGSPTCDPRDLAAWLLEKTAKLGPSVFMQLQLHKYIWDPNERER